MTSDPRRFPSKSGHDIDGETLASHTVEYLPRTQTRWSQGLRHGTRTSITEATQLEWVKRITRAAVGDHPSWTCRPHHSLGVYSTVCALCGSGYSCHFLGVDFGQQNAGRENYWRFCTDTTVNITVLVCGPYQIFTNTDVPSSGRCVSL